MSGIELGDKVRCKVSGFTGVATQRVENLNGCVQYTVRPPVDKDGKMGDAYCIDIENLEVLEKNPHKIHSRGPGGGPNTKPVQSM